jgi:iron complex transport system ATP-binding protein
VSASSKSLVSTERFRLTGVSAAYGKSRPDPALLGLDLSFSSGRVTALLGDNGSGKSTLLKVLAAILDPTSGEILLDGKPLFSRSRRELAQEIGYLPQSFEPLFPATAFELALLGRTPHLSRFGGPTAGDREAVSRALEEVDAGDLAQTDISEMSGGERQRILLARVLSGETDILLLDEPTANLDPRHRLLVIDAMRRRARAGGLVVFSSHEVDVAGAAADEAVLLRRGRLLGAGSLDETLTAPLLSELYGVTARVLPVEGARPHVLLLG